MRGDVSTARSFERPTHWRVHANDVYEAEAEVLAAAGTWDEAPRIVDEMREHEARAETTALVAFADRLEGRAAAAAGDAARAEASLRSAIERFDRLGTPWERALTEVDLASLLVSDGRHDEAQAVIAPALVTFEGLRAVKDLAVARQVLDRS
jgi:tetratricopeptide (TPR) repeat protein